MSEKSNVNQNKVIMYEELLKIKKSMDKICDLEENGEYYINELSEETKKLYPFGLSLDDLAQKVLEYANSLMTKG